MKNKFFLYIIYIYYALLLLLLASRQTAITAPPMGIRIAFMAAVILPTLIKREICYPAIITMFYTLTVEGFAYSYMPYTLSLYVIITLAIVLLLPKDKNRIRFPSFIIFFAVYIFIIDIIDIALGPYDSKLFQHTFFCFVLMVCYWVLSSNAPSAALTQLPLCFGVTTVVLSIAFLTNMEQYILSTYSNIDRTGWTDPNYFGMVIGMGTISSFIKLFDGEWKKTSIIGKIVYVSAIALSIPVLILNASRGAVLSVLIGFIVLMLFSRVKIVYKVLVTLVAIFAVVYLYNNDYFDLLMMRMENDDGTGSDRTTIWVSKLNAYLNGGVYHMIFGYGHEGGASLTGVTIGFHNDFIGFLVDYGIIGLCMLLYMLFYPIKILSKKSPAKPYVIVIIVYLSTCFMTLEPLLTGIMSYFVFYMYALLLAKHSKGYATLVSRKNLKSLMFRKNLK